MSLDVRGATRLSLLLACALPLSSCLVDGRHLVVKKGTGESASVLRDGGPVVDARGTQNGGSRTPSGTSDASPALDAPADAGGSTPPASGGAAGMTSGMDASAPPSTGGAGGASAGPVRDAQPDNALPWPTVCPDEDGNGIPDCQESLVANASFDHDTTGWDPETGLTAAWSADDAWKSPPIGAIALTNTNGFDQDGWGMSGARQCIGVSAAAYYRLTASVRLPRGQAAGAGGIGAWVFDAPGCGGNLVLGYTSDLVSTAGRWAPVEGTVQTPATAKSMLVRLVVAKPFRAEAVQAEFDGIRVRLKP